MFAIEIRDEESPGFLVGLGDILSLVPDDLRMVSWLVERIEGDSRGADLPWSAESWVDFEKDVRVRERRLSWSDLEWIAAMANVDNLIVSAQGSDSGTARVQLFDSSYWSVASSSRTIAERFLAAFKRAKLLETG